VTITRLVVGIVAIAALVAALPALRSNSDSLRHQVSSFLDSHGGGGKGQSAEQISSGEFAWAHGGMTPKQLENLVGQPADQSSVEVEGLKLDCMYYGVAAATGAYQFCFLDGKLSSKRRFESVP
jgi:hypothetical protein